MIEATCWQADGRADALEQRLRYHQYKIKAGLPFSSLTCWQNFASPASAHDVFRDPPREPCWITGIRLEREGEPKPRWLPLIPTSGFLIDATLYAALWWLILFAPAATRRFRRRRRGRCIHCGYDLAGLRRDDDATPTCPECGA